MIEVRPLFGGAGVEDRAGVVWAPAGLAETNALLRRAHYLGPIAGGAPFGGWVENRLVAVQVWRWPTSRRLPADGTWLELARWCLTPDAGRYAGSRQHAAAVRWLRHTRPTVTTLVSYSDPSAGHDGALYRACNWSWAPTWHRLRPPPTGHGRWAEGDQQAVKDRWVFPLRRDDRRRTVLAVEDQGALRRFVDDGGDLARLYDGR